MTNERKTAGTSPPLIPVAICFVLSGFAALLYETVWLREFAIAFGTSEQALAIVLGSYMGGLALGALVAARFEDRFRRPLWVYGVLELGIAVTALAVPYVLGAVRGLQIAFFSSADRPPEADEPSQIAFALIAAAAATILPTTMMGATLPMLAKHVVVSDDHLGPRIAVLYALNTLGAVLGTLTAAFVLLPALGLRQTVYVGAVINVSIFVVVWKLLLRRSPDSANERTDSPQVTPNAARGSKPKRRDASPDSDSEAERPSTWILWLIGISGGVSFAYEVLFTRMIGHFLGGSVFAFATMLASFLTGITIGGAIAARLAKRAETARIAFVYVQCATAALALASWYGLEQFANTLNTAAVAQLAAPVPRPLIAILVLLPPAISIGMTFPLAIRIHARTPADAASSAAKVYAANTVGGVVGALLVGYVILPNTNYETTAMAAILASLLVAALTLLLGGVRPIHFAPVGIAAALLAVAFPKQPEHLLRVSPFDKTVQQGELTFVKTGRSTTVTLFDDLRAFQILTGGLPEARTYPKGALTRPKGASNWLGALPTALRPDAESMLIVGFGSGIAALNASEALRSIDIFELEEGVIQANRQARSRRQKDPLADSRVRIILNDGRSGLSLTTRRYDIIVSQPSHPWTAGASHLYTRQYARLANDHLTDDGVFVQWMDISYLDVELFHSMAATLLDVFPSVHLFRPSGTSLLFVGFKNPWELPCSFPMPTNEKDLQRLRDLGIHSDADLWALHSLETDELRAICGDATVNTDNNNRLALKRLPIDRSETVRAIQADIVAAQTQPLRIAARCDVDLAYLARRRHILDRIESATLIAENIQDPAERLATQAFFAEFDDQFVEAVNLYRQSLGARPTSDALFGLFMVSRGMPGFDSNTFWQTHGPRERLSESHRVVVEAREALDAARFRAMSTLDVKLADVDSQDVAYFEANLARIHWRIVDGASGARVKRGREALDLIDQMLAFTRIKEISLYRLEAAVLAGRSDVIMETARLIAVVAQKSSAADTAMEPRARQMLGGYLQRCRQVLASLENRPAIDKWRLALVQQLIESALLGLQ